MGHFPPIDAEERFAARSFGFLESLGYGIRVVAKTSRKRTIRLERRARTCRPTRKRRE